MDEDIIEGVLSLEGSFILAAYEQWSRLARSGQKSTEKEMANLRNVVETLVKNNSPNVLDVKDVSATLESLAHRMSHLKKKLIELDKQEDISIKKCRARLDHLESIIKTENVQSETYTRWTKTRLDRILADYLLREGYYESALQFTKEMNMDALVDLDIFLGAKKIEDALRSHSCQEGLQWCNDNKSKLRKFKGSVDFEFSLRLQEYIELVRIGHLKEAIAYSKKNFGPFHENHLKEIQQVMALLAFTPATAPAPYKEYFEDSRWNRLVQEFKQSYYMLYGITNASLLSVFMQAGLSALKTPVCGKEGHKNLNCPVCQDNLTHIASNLPHSHHTNSFLVCRISGEMMNENNLPLMLPNGRVYCQNALKAMADNNHGQVTCPITGERFAFSSLKRVFIT